MQRLRFPLAASRVASAPAVHAVSLQKYRNVRMVGRALVKSRVPRCKQCSGMDGGWCARATGEEGVGREEGARGGGSLRVGERQERQRLAGDHKHTLV